MDCASEECVSVSGVSSRLSEQVQAGSRAEGEGLRRVRGRQRWRKSRPGKSCRSTRRREPTYNGRCMVSTLSGSHLVGPGEWPQSGQPTTFSSHHPRPTSLTTDQELILSLKFSTSDTLEPVVDLSLVLSRGAQGIVCLAGRLEKGRAKLRQGTETLTRRTVQAELQVMISRIQSVTA